MHWADLAGYGNGSAEPAEKPLDRSRRQQCESLARRVERRRYRGAFDEPGASCEPAVDRFFDDVLVMAEDPAVRARAAAAADAACAISCCRLADISEIVAGVRGVAVPGCEPARTDIIDGSAAHSQSNPITQLPTQP